MSQSAASLSSLIWSVADLLRGDYKPSEYGRVILPFTVVRRLDCVLGPTKANVNAATFFGHKLLRPAYAAASYL